MHWGYSAKLDQQVQFPFSFIISLSRFIYPTMKRQRSEVGASGPIKSRSFCSQSTRGIGDQREVLQTTSSPFCPAKTLFSSWAEFPVAQLRPMGTLGLSGAGLGITQGSKFPNEMFAMVCEMTVCRRITYLVQLQRASTDPGEVFLLSAGSHAPSGPMPSSWRTQQK